MFLCSQCTDVSTWYKIKMHLSDCGRGCEILQAGRINILDGSRALSIVERIATTLIERCYEASELMNRGRQELL